MNSECHSNEPKAEAVVTLGRDVSAFMLCRGSYTDWVGCLKTSPRYLQALLLLDAAGKRPEPRLRRTCLVKRANRWQCIARMPAPLLDRISFAPSHPLPWSRGILPKEPSRRTTSTSRIAAPAPPRMIRPRRRDYLLEELCMLRQFWPPRQYCPLR